jgi:glutamate/tyrosine decarboxylase-like PLP-dependent enzyme
VPGVCSISADLHKYGFAPMPASMIVYRSADLHAYQPYNVEDWPTGPYRTETVVGSRQGGAIAAAWAVMRYLGEEGFLASTAGIMRTKARLTEGINAIPGLKVLENDLSLLAYGADGELFDTATIAGGLRERGWYVMGSLQPPLVNLPLSPSSDEEIDAYLSALRDVVDGITEQTRSEGTLNYAS